MPEKPEALKVQVSIRAVHARLSRHLARKGLLLRATRGRQAFLDLGDYYTLDANRYLIVDYKFSIEGYVREAGVLRAWEVVVNADE